MNRRTIKTLSELDYTTLADIGIKEQTNNRNTFYDIATKEAFVYPEEDNDLIKIRPLHTRLLKNGHRLNTEISKWLVDVINYANIQQEELVTSNIGGDK